MRTIELTRRMQIFWDEGTQVRHTVQPSPPGTADKKQVEEFPRHYKSRLKSQSLPDGGMLDCAFLAEQMIIITNPLTDMHLPLLPL